jgi:hypothetical protein
VVRKLKIHRHIENSGRPKRKCENNNKMALKEVSHASER